MRLGKYKPTRNSAALRDSYSFGSVVDDFNAFVRFIGGSLRSYKSAFFDAIKVNGYLDYKSMLDDMVPEGRSDRDQEAVLIRSMQSDILARFFTKGTNIDSTGKIYSQNGNNVRDLITNMKTAKGNASAYASAEGLTLSGSSFKYKQWLYVNATKASDRVILDTRDGSGLNGYMVGIEASGSGTTPNGVILNITDASSTKVDLVYPAISVSTLTLVEIDWSLGSDPIVKYNGAVQSIGSTITNTTVVAFTANDTVEIGSLYDNSLKLDSCEVNHLFIGSSDGFNHGWILLETSGYITPDVLGSSNAYWTNPNWATPTRLGENWLNSVGYTEGLALDGTNDWVLTSGVISSIVNATEEIRIKTNFSIRSVTGSPVVISFDDGADGLLNVGVSSSTGQIFFFCPDGLLATALGSTVVPLDETHELEFVLDVTNDTAYIYLDGNVEITAPLTEATAVTVLSAFTRLTLGQELDASSPSNFLGGSIIMRNILVDDVDILDDIGYTLQSGALNCNFPALNQVNDSFGGLLVNKSAKYPAQLKSKVAVGNGTTTKLVIDGFTQTINSTTPLVIEMDSTVNETGTADCYFDSRTTSFYDGVVILNNSSDDIQVAIRRNASDVRIAYFTPSDRTHITRRFEIYINDFKYYENGVEITPHTETEAATPLTDFSNTNDIYLFQYWTDVDTSVTTDEIANLRLRHGSGDWEVDTVMQEGAGDRVYDLISGGYYTAEDIVWTNVSKCSHHNSRVGFYNDGTRNIPALRDNPLLDAVGNTITNSIWMLNDTFAELDLDPQNTVELNQLPNDWQVGDTPTAPLYVDQSQDGEFNFTIYKHVPVGARLTNIQNYHNN